MVLYLWLLLCVSSVAEGKCDENFYYDGLLEKCHHCSSRCNSPPTSCSKYCRTISKSSKEAGDQNVRVILIVLFIFFGACTALTVVLQLIHQKAFKRVLLAKVRKQDPSERERGSEVTEQSENMNGTVAAKGGMEVEEGLSSTHYNSNLPLPSTEEGTTVLVTTKTVQTYNCRTHYTQGVTLDVWKSGTV